MDGAKEILEQKFAAYKAGQLPEDDFFNELWGNVMLIPAGERGPFYDEIVDYIKLNYGEESRAFALATFSSANLAFHEEKYDLSLSLTAKADKLFTELNDADGVAICNVSYGGIYRTLGDFNLALKYLLDAYDQLSKTHRYYALEMASGFALAGIYTETNNLEKAIERYRKIIEFYENGNKIFLQMALDGLGVVYVRKGELDKAMEYYHKAFDMCVEIGSLGHKSRVLTDMGNLHSAKKDYDKAVEFHTEALRIREELNIPGGAITNLIHLSQLYLKQGKYEEVASCLNKGLKKAEALKVKLKIMQVHLLFCELYENLNDLGKSLTHYKIYHALSEEINNEDGKNRVKRAEMIFEAEQTKKENAVIRMQKQVIEEKNKDILDSINYAKRIQNALLASDELLSQNLQQYFVLFKPKDIVSGDFYWAIKQAERFYLAVCDSTGHGVPGAFMSLMNTSFLNEAITKENITRPNEVFNHARKRLIENFAQEGQQDGMDGILICLEEEKELSVAAAFNAPIIIRNGEITELVADKIPVGRSPRENESFTHQAIKLQKGDIIYLFTDGYADQFGGPKGKKLKYKQLQEIIVANSAKPMAEQKAILEKTFDDWKGNLEQVDDVLIMGIRV